MYIKISRLVVAAWIIMSLLVLYTAYHQDFLWAKTSRQVDLQPKMETKLLRPSIPSWDKKPSWNEFYAFIESTTPSCTHSEMFGGRNKNHARGRDGEKAVCLDGGVAPNSGDCLVLSFGINNEWSFDDAMEHYGCKVYSFDPTMNKTAHVRGKNIHFLPLGLGSSRRTVTTRKKTFEVQSYREILDTIGETDSIIDYLKIDIEGFELGFFENVLNDDVKLLNNVKQIGMEIHPGRSENIRNKLWCYIHLLLELQFSPVFSEPNMVAKNPFTFGKKTVSSCYEIVWINDKFVTLTKEIA